MVLFEAMAADTPIVATQVGGVADVVSESDAFLTAASDSEALAEAIRAVLSDPESAAARVASARRRLLEVFDTDGWVTRYDEVYRDAVERTVMGTGR